MRTSTLVLAVALSLMLAILSQRRADAGEEHNFAGSAQLDYHYLPGLPATTFGPSPATTFQGFTLEAAIKVAVDISDHLSANVKACYGCHGFELDMAYFDLRAADEFNLRFGRFSPSFGSFNLRHDPANHLLSDKPLPYDMGRMLRKEDWHNGVLPSPFPTNGFEIDGTHWFKDAVQLDYAAYVVMGFKNDTNPHPTDLDFQESHLPYYLTSDPQPAAGGRISMTLKATATADMTLGASGMFGTYNPANTLSYAIFGADFALRISRTALRAEYLVRRQQIDVSQPNAFKYPIVDQDGDLVSKSGAVIELEQPLGPDIDILGRVDGMLRVGNVVGGAGAAAASPLTDRSSVIRQTLGLAYAVERNLRLKGSVELWEFSYKDAAGRNDELSFHLGAVGSF